jgi:hypothetical protein
VKAVLKPVISSKLQGGVFAGSQASVGFDRLKTWEFFQGDCVNNCVFVLTELSGLSPLFLQEIVKLPG